MFAHITTPPEVRGLGTGGPRTGTGGQGTRVDAPTRRLFGGPPPTGPGRRSHPGTTVLGSSLRDTRPGRRVPLWDDSQLPPSLDKLEKPPERGGETVEECRKGSGHFKLLKLY